MEVSNEPVTQSTQVSTENVANKALKSVKKPYERNWADFLRRLLKNRKALFGLFLLALVVISAIFAPWIAPFPPDKLGTGPRLQGSSINHLFGTDALGRDLFSRVIYGSQTALQAGIITIGIATAFGTLIGLVAGFYGGWIDVLLMSHTHYLQ